MSIIVYSLNIIIYSKTIIFFSVTSSPYTLHINPAYYKKPCKTPYISLKIKLSFPYYVKYSD